MHNLESTEISKEIVGRIAHILSSRLSAIEGSLTMLKYYLFKNDHIDNETLIKAREAVNRMADGLHRAKITMGDFRKFSVPQKLRLVEIDLVSMLKAVIDSFEPIQHCEIELNHPQETLVILGDRIKLDDAFTEIIINAMNAMLDMPSRLCRLTITVRIESRNVQVNDCVRIDFCDSGPGISEADKKLVFEPFFSLKGGSGLGLAIVKTIILQHNGTIEEIGEYGKGAAFCVRLPINRQDAARK